MAAEVGIDEVIAEPLPKDKADVVAPGQPRQGCHRPLERRSGTAASPSRPLRNTLRP
ncbi:hypothetical protein [Actinacidiphila oryziradicis]|uniref:hypothetical protein n=1 Tax=Actinacidiphila oryziradicis TaxID=2571141 RepID=UPI00145E1D4E|nr:hypothetical protein [Actinacidiphila oryziradicis]